MIISILLLLVDEPLAPFTDNDKKIIQNKLDTVLIDGQSARHKWVARKNTTAYCGWVNAKNQMGAYTGWKPYYILYAKPTVIDKFEIVLGPVFGDIDSDDASQRIVFQFCQKYGYNPYTPPSD